MVLNRELNSANRVFEDVKCYLLAVVAQERHIDPYMLNYSQMRIEY